MYRTSKKYSKDETKEIIDVGGIVMSILKVKNVSYSYQDGNRIRDILNNVSYEFETGKFYTILGVSGSGKTTFLSLISGLDTPLNGGIFYKDEDIEKIGLENYRRNDIGIVFQNYNLIPYLNGVQNVLVAMGISDNVNKATMKEDAYKFLEKVGIDKETAERKVNKLSGGEQQRVAIARALSTNVSILMADEPTGNLDKETGQTIVDIFKKLAHEDNKCIIVVTHSDAIAKQSDVILRLNTDIRRFEETINESI